jgi:hypothetical protein
MIQFVYGKSFELTGGLIIAPLNRSVNKINTRALQLMGGEEEVYLAQDILSEGSVAPNEDDLANFPPKELKVFFL